ncbi:MAG: hypothetical protein KC457_31045, partial [Myxococcales bacterium]|nr:hypothetical protein [Myxococcales bacterium]
DGYHNALSEECDDGNDVDDDACSNACTTPACDDLIQNGDEWGLDCGGSCGLCTDLFSSDDDTLAIFELNGDTNDSSGNDRNAMLLGGNFVDTAWGQGLQVPGMAPQGFDWTAFTDLLVPPYTIEMVLTPEQTGCYQRLYSWNDNTDAGWYYCGGFQTYPSPPLGPQFPANERHYLTMVSVDGTALDVYYNGTLRGTTVTGFTAPGVNAIFFKDNINGTEQVEGVIEAVRLSSVARTDQEIMDQQTKLDLQP